MNTLTEHELRLRLRRLQQDHAPPVDLWPRIAQRLQDPPLPTTRPARLRLRRWVPVSLAASVLLAFGLTWNRDMPDRPEPLIHAEAVAMAAQYQDALDEYAHAPLQPELRPALEHLDQNALSIMAALERYPEARLLLDQLRRTYDRRLELTQRALITT